MTQPENQPNGKCVPYGHSYELYRRLFYIKKEYNNNAIPIFGTLIILEKKYFPRT